MRHVPIIFLVFNRPELTRQSFQAIRELGPERLFVVADGPRAHVEGEAEKCRQTREIATAVDWPCEVKTNFAETNLGLKKRVSSGITWAFEQVEEAIILEDDCVPEPSFFPFVAEMLEKYRDDTRIMHIAGDNFQKGRRRTEASYYFSRYAHCWGWATWRRAWRHFDFDLKLWPQLREGGWLKDMLHDDAAVPYWTDVFDRCAEINSWDFPWTYSCWVQSGLAILPNVNLVRNIGFGAEGTNTTSSDHPANDVSTEPMLFPLRHPEWIIRDAEADAFTHRTQFQIPLPPLWRRIVPGLLRRGRALGRRVTRCFPPRETAA